ALYSLPPRGTWSFADSFERGDLEAFAGLGMKQMAARHSAAVVASPGGEHDRALRVLLEPGDPPMRGNHRAEMRLRATRLGSMNEYRFRAWVPSGWIDQATETVVAQWHSVPDFWCGHAHVSGPLLLVIAGGRWILWSAWDERALARNQFGSG